MKKVLTLLVVLALFTSGLSVSAQKNDTSINNGLKVSLEDFNHFYGTPNSRDDVFFEADKNIQFSFNNINIVKDQINFSGTMINESEKSEISISGELFQGYKQAEGVDSIVGDLREESGEYKIVLFEIYNAREYSKSITSQSFSYTPHIKLYFTDKNQNIYLVETEIPTELNDIQIQKSEKISTDKDFFWFMNVLQPTENKELVTTDELIHTLGAYNQNTDSSALISPFAVNNFSDWTGPTTYYVSYNVGFNVVQAYSLPYGSWKATDVTGQNTWVNSFKIAEHVRVDGTTMRNVDNPFVYKNVKLLTGVGAKSTIISAMLDGNLKGKPSGTELTMRILEKVYSTALPAAPSLSTIRGWINDVKNATTSKTVKLGGSSIKLNNGPTVVEGLNQQAAHVMHKDTNINGTNSGHHLTLQTTVQYESSTGTSATANGIMTIIWEVYQPASTLYDSDSKELTFSYTIKK